jgi:hypothetical protein
MLFCMSSWHVTQGAMTSCMMWYIRRSSTLTPTVMGSDAHVFKRCSRTGVWTIQSWDNVNSHVHAELDYGIQGTWKVSECRNCVTNRKHYEETTDSWVIVRLESWIVKWVQNCVTNKGLSEYVDYKETMDCLEEMDYTETLDYVKLWSINSVL